MATGDITFAFRSDSELAIRSFNGASYGKWNGVENKVTGSGETGLLGTEQIDLVTKVGGLGSRSAIFFNGGSNVPTSKGLSVLMRVSFPDPASDVQGLYELNYGTNETYHTHLAYARLGTNQLRCTSFNDAFQTRYVNTTGVFAPSADTYSDLLFADNGGNSAGDFEVFLNNSLITSTNPAQEYPATRRTELDRFIMLGMTSVGLTSCKFFLNEFVIFEGKINPASVLLETIGDPGDTVLGALNGAARTKWVAAVPFDGLKSTDPGAANVNVTQPTYFIMGVAKVPSLVIDYPVESDVRLDVDYDSANLTGLLFVPKTTIGKVSVDVPVLESQVVSVAVEENVNVDVKVIEETVKVNVPVLPG